MAEYRGRSTLTLGAVVTIRVHSLIAVALTFGANATFAVTPLKLESIQARLFLSHTGTFSEALSPKDALRNVVLGGIGIIGPSQSTFVDVTLRGEPGAFSPKRTVVLTVTAPLRPKLTLKQLVGVLSTDGHFHVGFWLPDTGCVPLHLVATFAETKQHIETDIPFLCAE
jgi:hypothetical protein